MRTLTRLVMTPHCLLWASNSGALKLACILPHSSLDPRLASGVFATAKDEDRDRFIGNRRPVNCRERSIGRAHLPTTLTHDLGTIREGGDYGSGHQELFFLVRGSSFIRGETSDRFSHPPKLARTLGR